MKKTRRHWKIAFITTPQFRVENRDLAEAFIYRHMYTLCRNFNVMTTGRTYTLLKEILKNSILEVNKELIEEDTGFAISTSHDLERWRKTIKQGLKPTMASFQGMIHIIYELVEGRLDAVIHLTDWADRSAKPDSAVLSREANVHNVPAATDVETAEAFTKSWKADLARPSRTRPLFIKRQKAKYPPLKGLKGGDRVLAMVAHDNMKLELCRFAVENATHIFKNYDYVLSTGTTGGWIKRFMEAAGRGPDEIKKIRCCNSGPQGGDLQIAYAVVKKLCHKIIFLQDPSVSHPHDSDIRLFEQAVLSRDVKVELATNVESARLLIGI